ncbi:hypothetical protein QUA82_15025 [Microcoleus sp. F8-D3]
MLEIYSDFGLKTEIWAIVRSCDRVIFILTPSQIVNFPLLKQQFF